MPLPCLSKTLVCLQEDAADVGSGVDGLSAGSRRPAAHQASSRGGADHYHAELGRRVRT